MPRLVITKGPGIGRDHAVGTECVIGRAPDVDFSLEDPNASRRHGRVLAEGDAYVIEDLGSRNGTYVNGERVVQRQGLRDGDVVRIGGTEFMFRQKGLLESPARQRPAAVVPPVVPAAPVRGTSPARPVAAVPPVVSVPRTAPVAPVAPAVPAAPAPPSPPKKPAVSPIPVRRRRPDR